MLAFLKVSSLNGELFTELMEMNAKDVKLEGEFATARLEINRPTYPESSLSSPQFFTIACILLSSMLLLQCTSALSTFILTLQESSKDINKDVSIEDEEDEDDLVHPEDLLGEAVQQCNTRVQQF